MGKERLDRQLSQALSTKTPRSQTSNTKQQIDKQSSKTSTSKVTSKAGWSKSLTISSDGTGSQKQVHWGHKNRVFFVYLRIMNDQVLL